MKFASSSPPDFPTQHDRSVPVTAVQAAAPPNDEQPRPALRPLPRAAARASVLLKAALEALDEAGGTMWFDEMLAAVAKRIELTPFDNEVYEKTGKVRWQSLIEFFSINFSKAGLIAKKRGQWTLTPEGRTALFLPAEDILAKAVQAYEDWKAVQPIAEPADARRRVAAVGTASAGPAGTETRSLLRETAEADAGAEMEWFVKSMAPYDFQDLIAALLRAMGYTISFVSPPGVDGGTDILAYPDPVGARTPHIRVQVKHRADKVGREEVAALRGIIRQNREIGLFVSSGGFTPDAVREARSGAVHMELLDWKGVVDKWLAHYERMPWEDRSLLRLRPVYFLAAG
jgi:restriction system protein